MALVWVLAAAPSAAVLPTEVELDYYLPADTVYDAAIPRPAEVLGFEVGEWHARPAQIVAYAQRLAAASPRVRVEEIGRTHERRPQVLLTVSSPGNLARLDELLARHRAWSEPGVAASGEVPADMPAVVWLGYSIHGDEASGANASLVVAYHLAAAQGPAAEALLERLVVLIDPALNPDGLGRFAQWANGHRGAVPVADPLHREHVQPWPSGRTNHYWFDLNRDWLLLEHPESRHRVAVFQRFRPNVFADFHEMGSEATYFFQPGVPSRTNPLTPRRNVELTEALARHHATALDAVASLYFTRETFDDFYFGKGSTYPDIQGAVGVLFEQASVAGHARETGRGLLTFPFAIRNHVLTSLSTLHGAAELRQELLRFQRDGYRQALEEARRDTLGGWVIGPAADPARLAGLVAVLRQHGIEARRLTRDLTLDGESFRPGEAVVVPLAQRQALLARALFAAPTEFPDSTFYDISAWTLPLAFGLPWVAVPRRQWAADLAGEPAADALPPGALHDAPSPVGWAFEWTGYYAPRALQRLLAAGVRALGATRPFESDTAVGRRSFGYGSILVPAGVQEVEATRVRELLATAAHEDGIDVYALGSGLAAGGVDVGSPSVRPLAPLRPLLVVGEGVDPNEAGAVWHLLDHRMGIPVALVDAARLDGVRLHDYSHLVLTGGDHGTFGDETAAAIEAWVEDGGTLVASKGGAKWAETAVLGIDAEAAGAPAAEATASGPVPAEPVEPRPYAAWEGAVAERRIAGAIFSARLDLTHPLGYGYTRELQPVFRDGTTTLTPSDDPFATPLRYAADPLLAGYVSPQNLAALSGSPAAIVTRLGEGVVVRLADDPSFRGIWRGTQRLLLNALVFAPLVRDTALPEGVAPR
ncbi:MAG TPA: DUF4350 domain-containing protein [Thermoanaerobaculia bacterium]|nr:DUF4350 domain-containing protein [Thermoanaerobaculia bacterium]